MVVLAIGVTPDTALAKDAGLELGLKGSIVVNDRMETSVPDIYAVGDAVQVKHFVTGADTLLSLAGPANKQGLSLIHISLRQRGLLSAAGVRGHHGHHLDQLRHQCGHGLQHGPGDAGGRRHRHGDGLLGRAVPVLHRPGSRLRVANSKGASTPIAAACAFSVFPGGL